MVRPPLLVGTVVVVALALFFLGKGAWWVSAGLILGWFAIEWWAIWSHRKQHRDREQK